MGKKQKKKDTEFGGYGCIWEELESLGKFDKNILYEHILSINKNIYKIIHV